MSEENPIKTAQAGLGLVAEIMKVAGQNSEVKQAASNLGQTAVTLTKTINNVLVPLAAINFAFDKARVYFSERFQSDLREKADSIPAEHIVEPKASIAGPSLQGLAFAHEEQSLKDMFLNLLATSMDGRIAAEAHPAFVEIIKQLDSEDAKLVGEILTHQTPLPICQLHSANVSSVGYVVAAQHLLDLTDSSESQNPVEHPHLSAMVDNWVRLGLVEVDYQRAMADQRYYDWVKERPEYRRISEKIEEGREIKVQKGLLQRTDLGVRFAKAVGLISKDASQNADV